jgi:hypothetical protein
MLWLLLSVCVALNACASTPRPAVKPVLAETLPAPDFLHARVGVEYLPPIATHGSKPQEPAVVSSLDRGRSGGDGTPAGRRSENTGLDLSQARINSIEDPLERMTLRFMRDLMGEDRRRVQREIGVPVLARLRARTTQGFESILDEREREDQDARINEMQGALLRHPLRQALRELPLVKEGDVAFESWKADHVPLSGAYENNHRRGGGIGRMSLRLRWDSDDPVDVGWVYRGMRVTSGQEKLKLRFNHRLSKNVSMSIRSDFLYDNSNVDVWGDVQWEISKKTRLYVLVGDSVNLLTGSEFLPMVESGVKLPQWDRSLGVMFYVEHLF